MSSETPALRKLLLGDSEKSSPESDLQSQQQEKLREVFRVETVSKESSFLSLETEAEQRRLSELCTQYLYSHFDDMQKVDPNQKIALEVIAACEKPSFVEFTSDIFTSFDESTNARLRNTHVLAINDLKLARDIGSMDISMPESWTIENLQDLASLGMPESLILLLSDSYKAADYTEQRKATKTLFKMLRPLNAMRKRKEIVEAAQKAQKKCLEVSTNKALSTYTESLQYTLVRIPSRDSSTNLSTKEKVSQYQSLLESIRLVLDQTKNSKATLDTSVLLTLQKSITERLQTAKQTAIEYDTRAQQKKKSAIYDTVLRVTDILRYSKAKLTVEVFDQYTKALNQLESDYKKLENESESKSVFSTRIEEARKILHEKKWTTYDLGDPQKIREKIYTTYQNKKFAEGEKTAREWLKMALDVLKEVVDQQKDAFIQSWDVVWNKLEAGAHSYIQPFTATELGQVFFENGCNFSLFSLGVPEILNSAVEAHNTTHELLKVLRYNPVEIFRSLQQSDKVRDPYGKVEIETTSPLLAVRLICHDIRDFTLISKKSEIDNEDDSQASKELGLSYNNQISFRTAQGEMKAPLILINAKPHESLTQLKKTVDHETAHQKMIVKNGDERSNIREQQVLAEEKPIFPIERNLPDHQQTWRNEFNRQLKSATLTLRDEIQAFTEENDFDFQTIENILLKTGEDSFYEFVADDEWKEYYLNELEKLNLQPDDLEKQKAALMADISFAKEQYAQKVKNAIHEAEKLAKIFPPNAKGRAKAGLILRFATFKELQVMNRYFH